MGGQTNEPPSLSLAWIPVCPQALQQELALGWSTMEKLDQRAQVLGDPEAPEAPEQLGVVQERVREQLRALQELAATR